MSTTRSNPKSTGSVGYFTLNDTSSDGTTDTRSTASLTSKENRELLVASEKEKIKAMIKTLGQSHNEPEQANKNSKLWIDSLKDLNIQPFYPSELNPSKSQIATDITQNVKKALDYYPIIKKGVQWNFDYQAYLDELYAEKSLCESTVLELTGHMEKGLELRPKSYYEDRADRLYRKTELSATEVENTRRDGIGQSAMSVTQEKAFKSKLREDLNKKELESYDAHMDEYEERDAKRRQNKPILAAEKHRSIELQCQVYYTQNLKAMSEIICNKVITAILKHREISNRFQTVVVIKDTGDRIANPISISNFPAIVSQLQKIWGNRGLKTFFKSLEDFFCVGNMMKDGVSVRNKPMEAWELSLELGKLVANFVQHDFDRFLQIDLIAAAVFLSKIPDSDPNRTLIRTKGFEKIEEVEDTMAEGETIDWSSNPVFTTMSNYAETLQQASGKNNVNLYSDRKKDSNNNDNGAGNDRPKPNRQQEIIQRANSAAEITEQANSATQQQPQLPQPSRYIYKDEVNKNANVKCKTAANREVPYLAFKKQSSICTKCYPESGPANPCKSKCFSLQCKRCSMYGHSISQCKQSHSSDGQPITSN